MTQENKQLLVQDLSARIPYGVIINTPSNIFYPSNREDVKLDSVFGIDDKFYVTEDCGWPIEECKPYLRPISSMTKEEIKQYAEIWANREPYMPGGTVDFFNTHHLDYRGLIKKGLALEAPEDMYKL